MRWEDIERQFPDRGGSTLQGLLTHGARTALGFEAEPRDRKEALAQIADAIVNGWEYRDDHASKGALALLAALEGEWDLVGDCTGGALPGRVWVLKTYTDVRKLARHLAIVARSKLPAGYAMSPMREAQRQFLEGTSPFDPRALVLAAELFVRDIVRADDVRGTVRAWLAGEQIEFEEVVQLKAPADGEEPRVKIFERFAPELSDEERIAKMLDRYRGWPEPWGRHLEKERMALDDLVVSAFVGRIELPVGWELLVDPIVAAWLGVELDGTGARFRDLERLRPAEAIRDDWEDALFALVSGAKATFAGLVKVKKLPKFKPGQFFKEDARKLVRYLAAAIASDATEEEVMPAWLDFLARRSPATTPRIASESVPLRWKHLLVMQAAITHRIGGKSRGDVGRALQQVVSGA